MGLPVLNQAHFATAREGSDNANRNILLDLSNQEAFLALRDSEGRPKASAEVLRRYAASGLSDKNGVKRVVRVVTIPKGTRIYKLTGGLEAHEDAGAPVSVAERAVSLMKSEVLFKFPIVTPWWAPVAPFEEDLGGIRAHFENMVVNAAAFAGPAELTLREYARFMSAVVLEWNKLNYYVEVTLARDVNAYWGQFEEQVGTAISAKLTAPAGGNAGWGWTAAEGVRIEVVSGDAFIVYKGEENKRYYLPAHLGGLEAWQFYIPKFEKADVDEASVKVLPSRDSRALAEHFGCAGVFEEAQAMAAKFKQDAAYRAAMRGG